MRDFTHLFPPQTIRKEKYIPPTIKIAQAYQEAYEYFNEALFEPMFGEKLPHVVLNLSRKGKGTVAFFAPSRWKSIKAGEEHAEISLVPEWTNRPVKEVFSSLCHEMAHFKDHLDETSCKNGYHGTAWFKIMKRIGLPGKSAKGNSKYNVTHDIEPGGPFDKAFAAMPNHLKMPFVGTVTYKAAKNPDSLQGVRTKYECPSCGLNVRGKVGLDLNCNTCDEVLYDSGI